MTSLLRVRKYLLLMALLVVAAACTDSAETTTSTTPPTTLDPAQVEFEADVQLIRDLWSGEKIAFADGFDAGIEYWVANNYPPMGCTYDDYMASRFTSGPIDGLRIEHAIDERSITLDPGWIIPGGRLVGQPAEGRIYVMSAEAITTTPDDPNAPAATRDLHVTILDDRAHVFFGCPS